MKTNATVPGRTKLRLLFTGCLFAICFQLVTLNSFAQYTKLLDFAGVANGSTPRGSLISDGTDLYGMTYSGGANNLGTIFKIKPDGTGYVNLFDFDGAVSGSNPFGSLFSDGTLLYGMTSGGGINNFGTIFKIMPNGTGFAKLLDFAGTANGSGPLGSLISDGIFLYGMTSLGGTNNAGTIIKIMPDGTGFVKLWDFGGGSDGFSPFGSLISDGTFLYGTTSQGGSAGDGIIFKINTVGGGYTTLLNFTNEENPRGSLISDGTFLYGMTFGGGANNVGSIFKIKPDGSGFVTLLDFDGTTNGGSPQGSLILNGTFLYGMARDGGSNNLGTLFKIKTDGTGYVTLLDFDGPANGIAPLGTPIIITSLLYGLTSSGGTNNLGTIFKYSLLPTVTSFTPSNGPIGTTVTIIGTNFSAAPADNIVFFGATQAIVIAATGAQLTVTVPAGATYQPITVTVNGLTAFSSKPFDVTFAGGGIINACSFGPKVDFAIGGSAEGVAFGDIDGDGKADLVVTSAANTVVTVYRNTSISGVIDVNSFAPGVDFSTGSVPGFVDVADLDGDGKMDLVVTEQGSSTVSAFRNTSTIGAISFDPRVSFATGIDPYRVAIGDLDGDGKPELAVTNAGSNTISIFRNSSVGSTVTFAAKVDFAAGLNPLGIAIGDLDGDGKPDFIASNVSNDNVSVYRNTSTGSITTGSFATRVNFATGTIAQDVAIGDLDGDGKLDFIVAHQGDAVSVFRNISSPGSITTGSFASRVDFATGLNPDGVAISDLDGDGKPDLVVVNTSSNSVSVIKNISSSGSITTGSFEAKVDFITTGNNPNVCAVGDIDGDGKPDIVAPNYNGLSVSVLRNTVSYLLPTVSNFAPASGPVGTSVTITGTNFSATPSNNIVFFGATKATVTASTSTELTVTVPVGATYQPISVLVGCLTAYTNSPFVVTFPGSGIIDANTFGIKSDFASGSRPADISFGDLDGDGKADVTTINDLATTVSIFRNTTSTIGSVSFAARVDLALGGSPQSMEIGDMDGDSKLDLVTPNGTNQVSVYRNTSTIGAISFLPPVPFTTGGTPVSVAIGDIDGDGRADIAVGNATSNTVSVFRNTGTQGLISFAAKLDFTTGANPYSVAIGDVDGDGKLEVLTANRNVNTVSIFRNISTTGAIAFQARVDLAIGAGTQPHGVALGDLDGDGKPDIATANYSTRAVSVFRNNSTPGTITTGSFDARADFANSTTNNPTYVSIGDMNGDSKPDLLVGNDNGALMQVHRNISTPGSITASSFAPKVDYATGTRPYNAISGDLDGDGKPEIASANATSNTISILYNTVVPIPTITSFTPSSGPVGTTVTITGTNFSAIPANNIVYFGATKATVTASTTTQLTVTVPVGATYQPISVLVAGLTAFSSSPFLVTFAGGGVINACSFSAKVDFTSDATDWIPGIAISDIDGDGKPDFAVTNNATNSFSVFQNTSSPGTITAGSFASNVNFTTGTAPRGIAVGDLDGDGKPDVVITNHQAQSISIFRNTSSTGVINVTSFAAKVDFTTGFFPNYIEIADLDADGKPDLVAVNIGGNSISIFRNTSTIGTITSGSFAAKVDFTTGPSPLVADIGDLDNDGKPDIVVSNSSNNTISIFKNISASGIISAVSFAARVDFTTADPDDVAIGDLDGDGKPEITAANWLTNTVSVFRNASSTGLINSGSFAPSVLFVADQTPESIGIADIDGDGKPDLVVPSQSDVISVLKNTSSVGAITSGSFAPKVDFTAFNIPDDAAIGDLDGDGKPDIILSNYSDNKVAIYHNTVSSSSPPSISNFTPASGPIGSTVIITGTNFSTTPLNNTVKFNGTPATISASTTTSITTTVPVGATTGDITVAVGCLTATSGTSFTVSTASIIINPQPASVSVCEGANASFTIAATGTTNLMYQWQFSPNGPPAFVDIANGPNYTGATTTSLSVNTTASFGVGRYRCRINGDLAVEVITNDEGLFVNPLPAAPGVSGNSGCPSTSIMLSASGGINGQYRWYTLATGGTTIAGEVNGTYLTPPVTVTTTYFVAIIIGTCESTRTSVTATVLPLPPAPSVTPGSSCAPSSTVILNASGGVNGQYRWYTSSTGGTAIAGETNSAFTTPLLSTSTTYFVSINNGTCESLRTSVLAEIVSCTPVIAATSLQTQVGGQTSIDIAPLVSTINSPIDINSIKVIQQPTSGAIATVTGGVLQVDYAGVSFAGTDRLTIEACDMAVHCAQQEITIEVVGDITIFNALSPNGDNKNEVFYIQYIDLLPDTQMNRVSIFNRWGDIVFETQDYDNVNRVFRGLSQSGNELPTGTYYYKLEFPNGAATRTGFISLRK